ncbi:hypothetical protein JZ751_010740 [Albula glossodonta]|uniref:Uncharacterized protein n=1 Tax=Albula glossodonta TaxID=121402 RepID=A0A8T2N2K1_9TELE|nr:hypothetical protein JZ751_010740 [Albula glossodonta]
MAVEETLKENGFQAVASHGLQLTRDPSQCPSTLKIHTALISECCLGVRLCTLCRPRLGPCVRPAENQSFTWSNDDVLSQPLNQSGPTQEIPRKIFIRGQGWANCFLAIVELQSQPMVGLGLGFKHLRAPRETYVGHTGCYGVFGAASGLALAVPWERGT